MRHVRIVAIVLAVALSGCASLLNLLRGGLKTPTATFQKVDLTDASFESVTVAATFRIDNPNPLGLSIAGIGYGFTLDGRKLFDGQLPNGLTLTPQGASTLVVPVKIAFASLTSLGATLAKDEAPYQVQASATVRTPIGELTMPLSWSGTLPMPKLPRVDVKSVRVGQVSFTGAHLDVQLAVANPNRFALPLTALDGEVSIGGQRVASLALSQQHPLAAKATTEVALPIDVSLRGAGFAASTALARHGAPVRLTGHATIAGRVLPIDLTTTLR